MTSAQLICDSAKTLDALREEAPTPDWDARLGEYLQQTKDQKDHEATYRSQKAYLAPWIRWLKENGGRATTQRIKEYLTSRNNLMRTSYWQIGRAVRDFCNHWAESWERVELVPPHG